MFAPAGNACTMSEYNRLKSMLLDMQPKALKTGEQNQQRDMEEKRALVDTMFKYLDADEDGRLVGDELEKVGVELWLLFLTEAFVTHDGFNVGTSESSLNCNKI